MRKFLEVKEFLEDAVVDVHAPVGRGWPLAHGDT